MVLCYRGICSDMYFVHIAFVGYDYTEGGYQFARTYDWIGDPVNISLALGIDGIAAPLVLLNGIVLLGAVLISQT
ncbi:MAG: hypothetical protein CM1200mP15_03440 [Dehalococcoidia bacterium]|nr:MAG: hypothetical protein CM1200mP15_03440 [Dehalococcoidia bacterium]